MADEKASLEAPSSGRSEEKKSKLEQYEDSLRYKLWCLNLSQGLIDIFSSLVKTLPIALVVNVIALIITADERTIRLAGTIIFTVLLVVWLASLTTFLWLMLRHPKIERHVEMGRKLVERHTNQTEDAFRDYKQTYVPPVGDEIFMGSMLDDNGRVGNHVRKRTWRSKWAISPEIQNDMTYWNGPLVDDIDKLDVDAGVFYNFLDFFSERCSPLLTKWAAQHKDTSGSRYISSAIAALYRYYIGDVQNENDTMSAQGRNLIDSDARTFLERYFFKGDPSNPSDISSLVLRADLELLAKEARKLQVEAIAQRDRVLVKISYEYSGGR